MQTIAELRIFIANFNTSNFAFCAIFILETWLSEGDHLSLIQLYGYKYIPLRVVQLYIYRTNLNICINLN